MRNQALRTKLTALPLLAILLLMIVPASNFDAFATDSPLSFGSTFQLNDATMVVMDDSEASVEDGMHWLWHQDTSGVGLYYAQSDAGEDHTSNIHIQDLPDSNDSVHEGADLVIDGETVYIFYGYTDDSTGKEELYMKKSTDNGDTFGARVLIDSTVYYEAGNFGEGIVAKQDPTNDDLYVFFKCDSDCDTSQVTIGVMLSTNAGESWSRQADVSGMEYDEDFIYDPYFDKEGIHVDNGVIQLVFEAYEDDDWGDYFVYYNTSDDKGATWSFGFDGDDGLKLVPVGFDHSTANSDSLPNIHVAGSNTLVIFNESYNTATLVFNRSSDLGQSWETTNNPEAIPISCINGYDDWNTGQIGSYVAVVCSGIIDEDLFFIDSADLGATWNSEEVAISDLVGTDDEFTVVNVDVNENNMVFTIYYAEDDVTDFSTHLFYAQDPTGFSDFEHQELSALDGIALSTGAGSDNLPMACLVDDKLFLTWHETVANTFKWQSATLTNSGIVAPDTTAPVISPVFPPEPQSLVRDEVFEPLRFATATDDVDGDLTSSIMVEVNGVDITETGIYTVTYSVVDMAMNLAETEIQFFVKKPSTGTSSGSTSGGSQGSGGTTSTIPTLEDIPEPNVQDIQEPTSTPLLQFGDEGIETVSGLSIQDIFANLFGSRLGVDTGATVIEPPTVATSQPSGQPSTTGTSSQAGINIVNTISNFFANIFG